MSTQPSWPGLKKIPGNYLDYQNISPEIGSDLSIGFLVDILACGIVERRVISALVEDGLTPLKIGFLVRPKSRGLNGRLDVS